MNYGKLSELHLNTTPKYIETSSKITIGILPLYCPPISQAAVSAPTALSAVSPSFADLQQVNNNMKDWYIRLDSQPAGEEESQDTTITDPHMEKVDRLLQSFLVKPVLCRGSYNLNFLDDEGPPSIHTLSINESRC